MQRRLINFLEITFWDNEVNPTHPLTYTLTDEECEFLHGIYYPDLLKSVFDSKFNKKFTRTWFFIHDNCSKVLVKEVCATKVSQLFGDNFWDNEVNPTHPLTYTLTDEECEFLHGSYYPDLLKSVFDSKFNKKLPENMIFHPW